MLRLAAIRLACITQRSSIPLLAVHPFLPGVTPHALFRTGASWFRHSGLATQSPSRQRPYKQPSKHEIKITQYVRGHEVTLEVLGDPEEYKLERSKRATTAADYLPNKRKPSKQSPAASPPQATASPSFISAYLFRTKRQLQAFFLPSGYPDSVGSNYLQYTLWQAVTNFATTANGVLASTFLLYAVGLGAGAIPTAGALNWVLKDGLGQMGTLLFGKAIAHNFDIHSKSWYFLSFVLLSTATGERVIFLLLA